MRQVGQLTSLQDSEEDRQVSDPSDDSDSSEISGHPSEWQTQELCGLHSLLDNTLRDSEGEDHSRGCIAAGVVEDAAKIQRDILRHVVLPLRPLHGDSPRLSGGEEVLRKARMRQLPRVVEELSVLLQKSLRLAGTKIKTQSTKDQEAEQALMQLRQQVQMLYLEKVQQDELVQKLEDALQESQGQRRSISPQRGVQRSNANLRRRLVEAEKELEEAKEEIVRLTNPLREIQRPKEDLEPPNIKIASTMHDVAEQERREADLRAKLREANDANEALVRQNKKDLQALQDKLRAECEQEITERVQVQLHEVHGKAFAEGTHEAVEWARREAKEEISALQELLGIREQQELQLQKTVHDLEASHKQDLQENTALQAPRLAETNDTALRSQLRSWASSNLGDASFSLPDDPLSRKEKVHRVLCLYEKELATVNCQHEELQEKYTHLQKEYTHFQKEYCSLQNDHEQILEENASLSAENQQVRCEYSSLQSDHEQILEENASLSAVNQQVRCEFDDSRTRLQEQCDRLSMENQRLRLDIDRGQEELQEEYSKRLTQLQEEERATYQQLFKQQEEEYSKRLTQLQEEERATYQQLFKQQEEFNLRVDQIQDVNERLTRENQCLLAENDHISKENKRLVDAESQWRCLGSGAASDTTEFESSKEELPSARAKADGEGKPKTSTIKVKPLVLPKRGSDDTGPHIHSDRPVEAWLACPAHKFAPEVTEPKENVSKPQENEQTLVGLWKQWSGGFNLLASSRHIGERQTSCVSKKPEQLS